MLDIRDLMTNQVYLFAKYTKYLNKLTTNLYMNSLFKYLIFNNKEFQSVIEGKVV